MSDNVETESNTAAQYDPAEVTRPLADIVEKDDGAVLLVELPGCGTDNVDLTFEEGRLTLVGEPTKVMPDSGQPAHVEFLPTRYERAFQISDDFDPDKTEAQVKDGVLTVRLYRSEKVAPRKIAVTAG